ncbi:unnamed protein product [Caenorhabditis sp. 36 PRJEB53466]|nr:unnamed protein product [Caenorhabditis sp. 36 PRJEB53466]
MAIQSPNTSVTSRGVEEAVDDVAEDVEADLELAVVEVIVLGLEDVLKKEKDWQSSRKKLLSDDVEKMLQKKKKLQKKVNAPDPLAIKTNLIELKVVGEVGRLGAKP